MDQTTSQNQPLLTVKSFIASFVIILVVYLLVSAFIQPTPKTAKKEKSGPFSAQQFEYKVKEGEDHSDNSILSIPIEGIILTDRSADIGFFNFLQEGSATYGYEVKEKLTRAAKDPSIKAVMLDINSPGGTVTGANAIGEGVAYYRQATGKPVFAHINDLGASGAYWSAASTDYIVSDVGSIVGSIGVIMGPFKYYNKVTSESSFGGGVQTDGGIDYQFISAGQYKDTGSPYRRMTDEEQKHWQTSINNEYDRFVEYISARRHLSRETITNTIKALPYDTKRALQLGLIDKEGSKEDTLAMLAQKAKIQDYNVVEENKTLDFFDNLFSRAAVLIPKKQAACSWCHQPLLLYDGSYSWLP